MLVCTLPSDEISVVVVIIPRFASSSCLQECVSHVLGVPSNKIVCKVCSLPSLAGRLTILSLPLFVCPPMAHVVSGKSTRLCIFACANGNWFSFAQVKRMGGGFGGKETRSMNITAYAAIAAHVLKVWFLDFCWLCDSLRFWPITQLLSIFFV